MQTRDEEKKHELERRRTLAQELANSLKLRAVNIEVTDDVTKIEINEEKADAEAKQAIESLKSQLTCSPLLETLINIKYIKDEKGKSYFNIFYVIHDDWGGKDPIELSDLIRTRILKYAAKNPLFIENEEEESKPTQLLLEKLGQNFQVTHIVFKGGKELKFSLDEMQKLADLICGNEQEAKAANTTLLLIPEITPTAGMSNEDIAKFNVLVEKIAHQIFAKNLNLLFQKEGLTAGIAFDVANRRANIGNRFENNPRRPEVTTLVANFLFGEYNARSGLPEGLDRKSFGDIKKRDRFSETRHFRNVTEETTKQTQESQPANSDAPKGKKVP